MKLDSFTPEQKDKLFKTTFKIRNEDYRSPALKAFILNLESLNTDLQRQRLIDDTVSLEKEFSKSEAIEAFEEKLDYLSPEQREQLKKVNGGRPLLPAIPNLRF